MIASQPSLKDPRQCWKEIGRFVKDMPHTKGSVTGPTCFESRKAPEHQGRSHQLWAPEKKCCKCWWWQNHGAAFSRYPNLPCPSYFWWACGCFDTSSDALTPKQNKLPLKVLLRLLQLHCCHQQQFRGKLAIKVQPWKAAELCKDLGCAPVVKLCGSNLIPSGSDCGSLCLPTDLAPSGNNDLQKTSWLA